VRVGYRDDARSGSTGVVATVVQMLTGAAGSSGFKGIVGRHARAGLARFAPELPLALRFTRLDNGDAVDAEACLDLLPRDGVLESLLDDAARGHADATALRRLGERWQARVRLLLLEMADDPGLFVVRAARRPMRLAAASVAA
jgi:hypothetical protein